MTLDITTRGIMTIPPVLLGIIQLGTLTLSDAIGIMTHSITAIGILTPSIIAGSISIKETATLCLNDTQCHYAL